MKPLLHAINIGTLAAWLSMAAFGTLAIVVPAALDFAAPEKPAAEPFADLESIVLTEDFSVGEEAPSEETDTGDTGGADDAEVPPLAGNALPQPPQMPETEDFPQLPSVPDLPAPKPEIARKPAPRPTRQPDRPTAGSTRGKAEARGKTGAGGTNGGSGMSDAKRLAGGRMPAPSYPAAARSRGQQGTVVVEFVVGENGRVISAYAKSASPWPLLNDRAVSTVRGWRFPPGKVSKYVRPITFKLN